MGIQAEGRRGRPSRGGQAGPPRVTLVTPACNCLRGLIAGHATGRGAGMVKATLGGGGPPEGKRPTPPGPHRRPDAGTSSSGSRRFGVGRAGNRPGRTEGRGTGPESRGVRSGRSPAGEEVEQRVLLLLGAGRHGRAGFAARRRCRRREAARRMREAARSASRAALRRPPAPSPCRRVPTTRSLGPHTPRRGRRPVTGLCGRSRASSGTPPRGRHVAGAGSDVSRRRALGR